MDEQKTDKPKRSGEKEHPHFTNQRVSEAMAKGKKLRGAKYIYMGKLGGYWEGGGLGKRKVPQGENNKNLEYDKYGKLLRRGRI